MKIEIILIIFLIISNCLWLGCYILKYKEANSYLKKWRYLAEKYYDIHNWYCSLTRQQSISKLTDNEVKNTIINKLADEYAESQIVRGKNIPEWDETVKRIIIRNFIAGFMSCEKEYKL